MLILKKKRIYLNLQGGPETSQAIPTDYLSLIPPQIWLKPNLTTTTKKKSSITYSEKVNFVSAKSAMTSSLLQQPLILNSSPTLTSKVMLPAIPLETISFWQIPKCTRSTLISSKSNYNTLEKLILNLTSKQHCKLGFDGTPWPCLTLTNQTAAKELRNQFFNATVT